MGGGENNCVIEGIQSLFCENLAWWLNVHHGQK